MATDNDGGSGFWGFVDKFKRGLSGQPPAQYDAMQKARERAQRGMPNEKLLDFMPNNSGILRRADENSPGSPLVNFFQALGLVSPARPKIERQRPAQIERRDQTTAQIDAQAALLEADRQAQISHLPKELQGQIKPGPDGIDVAVSAPAVAEPSIAPPAPESQPPSATSAPVDGSGPLESRKLNADETAPPPAAKVPPVSEAPVKGRFSADIYESARKQAGGTTPALDAAFDHAKKQDSRVADAATEARISAEVHADGLTNVKVSGGKPEPVRVAAAHTAPELMTP